MSSIELSPPSLILSYENCERALFEPPSCPDGLMLYEANILLHLLLRPTFLSEYPPSFTHIQIST